jgi:UDP:flavonoid glycosyltransferase YjiC (YdhE family)
MSSGLSYPVLLYEIPKNILAIFSLIYVTTFDPRIKLLKEARTAHGILGPLPTLTPWIKDVPHLCPSLPDIDLPMEVPPNITFCGPITLKEIPLSRSDPELLTWLEKGPTIIVQLGTHEQASTEMAIELAGGLRVILDQRPDIQVLWKLKNAKSFKDTLDEVLGQDVKLGRVKIEAWINADPISILETGHIVCAVHHGGANSFFEAAWYVLTLQASLIAFISANEVP